MAKKKPSSMEKTIELPPLELLGHGAAEDYESGRPEVFVPSGVKALDDLILGAVAGEIILIAGKPGEGKTSLAIQWATQEAQNGGVSAILSLEMGRRALRNRLISGLTGIPMHILRTRAWPGPTHKKKAIEAAEYLASIPLYVDDRSGLSGQQVYDAIVSWKSRGVTLGMVDYIQRMGGESESRVQQVGEAVRSIKNAAKDVDLPIIAISSLNRTGGATDKPKLSHLRDSGDLEFEADTILMFHYPDDDLHEDVRMCDIHVMKQRNGPTGVASVQFNKPATTFEDVPQGRKEIRE
jgi:replicative DNA helicase